MKSAISLALAAAFTHVGAQQMSGDGQQQMQRSQQGTHQQQMQDRHAQMQQQMQQQRYKPVSASQIVNQTIYTQNRQSIGTVEYLMRDANDRGYAVVNDGSQQRLVPLTGLTWVDNRFVVSRLHSDQNLPIFNDRIASSYERLGNDAQLRVALAEPGSGPQAGMSRMQQGEGRQQQARQQQLQGEPAQVIVRQAQPQLSIEQAQPIVRVQQPQPDVQVTQPKPQIIVRQKPPTITVEQPQPEIIVRMPEPDVNVAMAQPQVQVRMPEPQVRVAESNQQPAVTVRQNQARVQVDRPQQQARVNVERSEPQVQFERTGEPNVVYRQAQGQPTIRYERMEQAQQGQQRQQLAQQDRQQQQAMVRQQSAQDRVTTAAVGTRGAKDRWDLARDRLGVTDERSLAVAAAATDFLTVSDLQGMDVSNARGEQLGEVSQIIRTPNDGTLVVVEHGGFLGIGEEKVALPLERFFYGNDQLVIRGVTEEELEAMADWRDRYTNWTPYPMGERIELGLWE